MESKKPKRDEKRRPRNNRKEEVREYSYPETNKVTGILSISARGTGFVRVLSLPDKIEIEPQFLSTALNGDTVTVLMHPRRANTPPSGEITSIDRRSKKGFAGIITQKNDVFTLTPHDHRDAFQIIIPKDDLMGAQNGNYVFGVITDWTNRETIPYGKVVEVLGTSAVHDARMKGIALERGFSSTFPRAVEDEADEIEARGIQEEDLKNRKDFRAITTFTIDPFDAKDFDDAISYRVLPNGHFEIGVHIADVSHYVQPGTELDREAYDRATSVYLVDRTIPMLPEALSNDLCSLNPNVDRLTFGAVFEMDETGQVFHSWIGRTIIHSDKRFTYEEAQEILNAKTGIFFDELNTLNQIAKKLSAQRYKAGALSLETDEVKFKLDENGVPHSVYVKERGDTHKLVEEFMLLANTQVAIYGSHKEEKERLFLYRIHDKPNKDKTKDLQSFLEVLGYKIETKDGVIPSKILNDIARDAQASDLGDAVQTSIVRSMAKAKYSTKNIGHYGLAFKYYSHFTSPIRRYPDLIVHRLLATYLAGGGLSKDAPMQYEKYAEHTSLREIEASEAERESIKLKQVEYIANHKTELFEGVITGISNMGIFVAETTTRAEGLVRMRDIGDDYFEYNERKFAIIGKRTKKEYRLGDHSKIRVKQVDLERKTIDYMFVETTK